MGSSTPSFTDDVDHEGAVPDTTPVADLAYPDSSSSPSVRTEMAPRVATTITGLVLLGFVLVALSYVDFAHFDLGGRVLCLGALVILAALQILHSFPRLAPRIANYRRWTLAVQALITFLPFVYFSRAWLGMPGLLSASVLLVLPPVVAWPAFAGVAVVTGVIQFAVGYDTGQLGYNLVATCLTGLVLFGLSRLADLVRALQSAREELARMAVAEERLRFARDLHDLLGYSLSTITVKCELALRLVRVGQQDTVSDAGAGTARQHAEEELLEVLDTARQALADIRSVATYYRQLHVIPEIAAAKDMLEAIGIATTVKVDKISITPASDTILATVVREGLTNMLRHAKPGRCRIELGCTSTQVRLVLLNDGTGESLLACDNTAGGNGLSNLDARLAPLGGSLNAGLRDDGWFELAVAVPLERQEQPKTLFRASPTPARCARRQPDCAR